MYIKRTVEKSILEAAKSFPCIVLYGPRQVGKSTTLDYVFPGNFNRVTLDDTEDRELAEKNPKLFLEVNPWPTIIDEIQKVPALLDAIKIKIDEQRKIWLKNNEERKLMYVLTGSNRFELQQGISETLAGRCGIIEMSSFTLREKKAMEAHLFTPKIEVLIQRSQQEKSEYLTRTQIFEEIYKGFNINEIAAKRMINSNAKGRGEISELLITNYKEIEDCIQENSITKKIVLN